MKLQNLLVALMTSILVLVSAPRSAGAQAGATTDAQENHIRQWVLARLKYTNCSQVDRESIQKVVIDGLEKVAKINPSLMRNRMAATAARTANYNCSVDDMRDVDGDAIIDMWGPGLFSSKLKSESSISIGRAIRRINLSFAFETVVLHEFLHFMRFDNLHVSLHNDPDLMYSHAGLLYDAVFSCAIAAFPNENRYAYFGIVAKGNITLTTYAQACAAAISNPKGVDVRIEDLKFDQETFNGRQLRGSSDCYFRAKATERVSGENYNRPPAFADVKSRCEK